MQLDSKLTLESAIEIVKQQERIHSQQETIQQDSKKHFIEKISRGGGKERGNMSNSSSFEKKWSCFQCGGTRKHQKFQCPAKDKKCHNCNIIGHYAMKCRNQSKPNYKVGEVVAPRCEESNFENDYHFLGSVSENEDISEWVASLKICNEENFMRIFV